ncbi:MAG TPA: hypothetical protein VME70_08820 [Mycobacteriales bacterium]|nr:hypothetical protein [Mycobacteriales bacterium]
MTDRSDDDLVPCGQAGILENAHGERDLMLSRNPAHRFTILSPGKANSGVFGEDGQLQVFDVWESQEAFDEFVTYLGPVMEELGIELAQPPTIRPIVDLVQQ